MCNVKKSEISRLAEQCMFLRDNRNNPRVATLEEMKYLLIACL
jgi:alcohol dehydrogenase class IV